MCFHKSHLNGLWGCKIPVWPLEMITLFSFPLWLSLQEQQFHANGEPKSIKRLPSERRIRLLLYYWYIHTTYILGWLPFCILQKENKIRTWWKEKYEYPNLPESFSMPKVHSDWWIKRQQSVRNRVKGKEKQNIGFFVKQRMRTTRFAIIIRPSLRFPYSRKFCCFCFLLCVWTQKSFFLVFYLS